MRNVLQLNTICLPISPILPPRHHRLLLAINRIQMRMARPNLARLRPSLPILVVSSKVLSAPTTPLPRITKSIASLTCVVFASNSANAPGKIVVSRHTTVGALRSVGRHFNLGTRSEIFKLSSLDFSLSICSTFTPFVINTTLMLPRTKQRGSPHR